MKTYVRIAICSSTFSMAVIALHSWLCHTGIMTCTVAENISISEAILPFLMIFGILSVAGTGVVIFIEQLVKIPIFSSQLLLMSWRSMAGGISGYFMASLDRIFIMSFSITSGFTFSVEHLSFTIGGVVCALVNGMLLLSRPTEQPPSA